MLIRGHSQIYMPDHPLLIPQPLRIACSLAVVEAVSAQVRGWQKSGRTDGGVSLASVAKLRRH